MRFHLGMSFKPKDIIKWIGIISMALFGFLQIGGIKTAHAYVKIETTDGEKNVDKEWNIDFDNGPFQDCSNQDCTANTYSLPRTFLYSPSLYWYVGAQKGSNIGIVADYNIWIETPGVVAGVQPGYLSMGYFNSVYDTIKAENLRCVVGDGFKSGYTTSVGSPQVSNFEKHINVGLNNTTKKAYAIINIKFTYNQQIPQFNDNQTNMSCWFVREPSNGLFGDFIPDYYDSSKSTGLLSFAYDINNLTYMVSDHPLANQLNEINSNINNINNNLDELHQSITVVDHHVNDVKDTLTDETAPSITDDTFGDIDMASNTAISGLITMPITILQRLNNSLGDTCTPYELPFGLTGGSEKVVFPCIHPEEYLGSTIWTYIDLFVCFFMIYNIAMLIISSFESITSLEDTFASLYEPRHAYTGYKPKHGGDD